MSLARFRVVAKLDRASGARAATVTVDRETNVMTVRALRGRRIWATTLDAAAQLVVERAVKLEVAERRAERAQKNRRTP